MALRQTYEKAINLCRKSHVPVLIHVEDLTQPQGHSTSGSHERYKSKDRLAWEREHDCNVKFRNWILDNGYADEEMLDKIDKEAKKYVRDAKNKAWTAFTKPIKAAIGQLKPIYAQIDEADGTTIGADFAKALDDLINPTYSEVVENARRLYYRSGQVDDDARSALRKFLRQAKANGQERYYTNLYSHSKYAALNIPVVAPVFDAEPQQINGYQLINKYFDHVLGEYPNVVAFGEDVGQIGDVNQGFAGLQEKYGIERVFDAGIREWSIVGGGIGLAMRGFRPIVEIQYLDYLVYGLEPMTDDLATLRYRTDGLEQAPVIIRTRGHRLEGIWHAGSPMGMIINALRGIYVCVPRNMTQAAGMYNTLLQSDDPALVVECLNGYRLKEDLPSNLGEYTVPLGVPEILQKGTDVTLVTYGSCVRVAQEGIELLENHGISVELVDIQTLLPFDLEQQILSSLKKTNRIVFMDEDVPGGATAFMMQEVLEKQGGYQFLDSQPKTITAGAHRTPYGSDGDYFTKPNAEDVFETIYQLMQEVEPGRFGLAL